MPKTLAAPPSVGGAERGGIAPTRRTAGPPVAASAATTVVIVDDNAAVRRALGALVESAGLAVAAYGSSDEFLAAYDPARPGCLVLDVRLRQGSGLDLQDELRRRKSILPIIVLTGHANVQSAVRARKAGAFAYLQKPAPPKLLLERITAAIGVDRRARAAAPEGGAFATRRAHLTPREREVMDLLISGSPSLQIATSLRISVRTVEGHRRRVLTKMNVSSVARLVSSGPVRR